MQIPHIICVAFSSLIIQKYWHVTQIDVTSVKIEYAATPVVLLLQVTSLFFQHGTSRWQPWFHDCINII